jgi:threonine dehydrogenase-like Zn-dependent dehydrogenase
MRALSWDGTVARVAEQVRPQPAAGTAVVRVDVAGICNTDLELVRGYMSFRGVLGHEFVGTVDDGPPDWRGQRVVGEINFACGHCPMCTRGLQRHCPTRRVMGILDANGAFAEYVAVPVANLHRVPDAIDDEHAVFTEPLAAAFEILDQVCLSSGIDCVVLGDGKLGLLVAQVLGLAGARVLAVGKHADHLAIVRRRGIETVLVSDWQRVAADVVVDATGSAASLAMAIAATKPRGTLVLKSTVANSLPINLAPLVINEITVVGSRCGRFAPALQALETGSVDVASLIAARLPLADGVEALRRAAVPGTLKVLLRP